MVLCLIGFAPASSLAPFLKQMIHWILRVGLYWGLFLVALGSVSAQGASPPVGDGLLGTYYQGRNFEQFRHRQVDATIDFQRRNQSPVEGVPAEDFSARWTGWLRVPTSGHYVLYLDVDDGARLWLDSRQLLNEWRGQAISSYSVEVDLLAGRSYALRLDYCQYGADSYAQLAWVRPEQLAQGERAASWRTLWGLVADPPRRAVIPTRYLFSVDPAGHPAPARPTPQLRQPPVRVPRTARPPLPHPPAFARRPLVKSLRPVVPVVAPTPVTPTSPNLAQQLGQGQAVVWPNLYFAQGRADLLPAARASLDTLVSVLHQQPQVRLQVQGHTDNQGDSSLNRQLSQQRAEVVCHYLVAGGVADSRLQAKGYGGSRPLADNRVPALRARNRRVVLQPIP
jgi:outer membrane protein OmpA-like peptidoglycan-associated protein